jgi:hypothetical protein
MMGSEVDQLCILLEQINSSVADTRVNNKVSEIIEGILSIQEGEKDINAYLIPGLNGKVIVRYNKNSRKYKVTIKTFAFINIMKAISKHMHHIIFMLRSLALNSPNLIEQYKDSMKEAIMLDDVIDIKNEKNHEILLSDENYFLMKFNSTRNGYSIFKKIDKS